MESHPEDYTYTLLHGQLTGRSRVSRRKLKFAFFGAVAVAVVVLVVCSLMVSTSNPSADSTSARQDDETWADWFIRTSMRDYNPEKNVEFKSHLKPVWKGLTSTQPSQGHLSYTGSPDTMRLMWMTRDKTASTVQWGLQPGNYANHVSGIPTIAYGQDELCAEPANSTGWDGEFYMHDLLMEGLAPSVTYYYRFGSEEHGWSKEFQFVSAPLVGPDTHVDFIALGDLGEPSNEPDCVHTIQHLVKHELDRNQFVMHVGDFAYAWGLNVRWDLFFDGIEPVATRMPYQVLIGNHEVQLAESNGECGTPFYYRFHMPENAIPFKPSKAATRLTLSSSSSSSSASSVSSSISTSPATSAAVASAAGHHHTPTPTPTPAPPPVSSTTLRSSSAISSSMTSSKHSKYLSMEEMDVLSRQTGSANNLWYSYDWGSIHFTVMSSEHNFFEDSEQYKWVARDLARVDRKVTPWLIFVGHRPMYSSNGAGFSESMQSVYEHLFEEYKVDLALWGHVHGYERTCPVLKNECVSKFDKDNVVVDPKGTVHVTIGMSGKELAGKWDSHPKWSEARILEFGYTRINTAGGKSLHFEFTKNHDRSVADQFSIVKSGST